MGGVARGLADRAGSAKPDLPRHPPRPTHGGRGARFNDVVADPALAHWTLAFLFDFD